jgi:hypothetical protein
MTRQEKEMTYVRSEQTTVQKQVKIVLLCSAVIVNECGQQVLTANEKKERKIELIKGTLYHDDGMASIDLGFDAVDTEPVKWEDGHIMFSFSSDPKCNECCFSVEWSTSDNVNAFVTVTASFAWHNNSVPDIEVGQWDRVMMLPVVT